ncbi:hypothetical protein RMSM_04198 [Rhodopirellula maiorica SM1]|uniref:Uncharacterized protein n=1 Tax=Rhodopirellula maiorica SM1 TaxID=1265738 RepID=M5RHV1_9BACT|nr:hypothetical protein RMSM_04198 [Rhodopirellula maiorica SM1]
MKSNALFSAPGFFLPPDGSRRDRYETYEHRPLQPRAAWARRIGVARTRVPD